MILLTLVGLDEAEQISETKRILSEELPRDNYIVLKKIISFLVRVRSDGNILKKAEIWWKRMFL